MKRIHFSNLDLNLLRVFEALCEERSVTRAGERLGLTQSAVSHALNRLRISLDDDLFIRTADGMRPTPWTKEAAPRISRALGMMQRALAPADFEPELSDRRFTLGLTPYLSAVLAPRVTALFRARAPKAELTLRHHDLSISEALDTGRLDLALGAFGRVDERFERRFLFRERLVWVLRRQHPAANAPLTLEALAKVPHIIVSNAEGPSSLDTPFADHGIERVLVWGDGGGYSQAMERISGPRPPAMTAPDSQTLLSIVSHTDLAALAPLRLARNFQDVYNLAIFDPPYETRPIEMTALWRRDHGAHPAVAWLGDLVLEAGAALEAEGL